MLLCDLPLHYAEMGLVAPLISLLVSAFLILFSRIRLVILNILRYNLVQTVIAAVAFGLLASGLMFLSGMVINSIY